MAQELFSWLNQSNPPPQTGFADYEFPEAGDVRTPVDANPDDATMPYAPPPDSRQPPGTQRTPAGAMSPEGIEMLPNTGYPLERRMEPDPNVIGRVGPVDTWDYAYELRPVYAIPADQGGGEYVGDLKYAPTIPQNSQPIRYVKVPIAAKMS